MTKNSCLKRPAVVSRIAFFALLLMTVATATLHFGAPAAQAAQATLSWKAPITYVNGTPITSLGGYKVYAGTTSGNYSQNVSVGNVTSYNLTGLNDATTYYLAVTAYDAAGTVSGLSNQVAFTTPAAPPSATLYTLTASAGSGGTITPSGSMIISKGSNQTYTITPAAGYTIAAVTVDGASVGAVSSYTSSNVSANHTISASFAATSGSGGGSSGGTVTSSATWLNQAVASQTGAFTASFDMVPSANNIDGLTGFSAIQAKAFADLAAVVRFNTSGTIDARNGSAYAAKVAIPYSAGKSYHVRMLINVSTHKYDVYVTPGGGTETQLAAGYAFRTEQAAAMALNNLGVFADVGTHQTQNLSVTAAAPAPAPTPAPTTTSYSIKATAYANGSISPAGATAVASGTSKTYSITPASGYLVSSVKVDGVSVGAVSTYTFSGVKANHTLAASFKLK